jgi:hypothetical protein
MFMPTQEFVVDAKGRKKALLPTTQQHETLIEDLHDLAVVAERRKEKPITLAELKRQLKKDL